MGDGKSNNKLESLVTQAGPTAQPNGVVPSSTNGSGTVDNRHEPSNGVLASLCRCFRPASPKASKRNSATTKPSAVVPTPSPSIPQHTFELPQLAPQTGKHAGKMTLVLDLDETLIHSSFRPVESADIVITVEIEGEHHYVYVRKRPFVDEFLERLAPLWELVVYTASMAKYADPLMDKLDKKAVVPHRLFREACTKTRGGYVKDLSKLGRDLHKVCIIDNSPICYSLQPENAIPIKTWLDDPTDRELRDLIPILIALAGVDDIPAVLKETLHNEEEDEEDGND